MKATRKAKHT